MPAWAGKWKGGRYYLDADGRRVFFIERRKRSVRLDTHDEALAVGQLATAWEAFDPMTPSNLRHTFITLSGEVGELVTYKAPGVDRARIQQVVGHRAGSSMTSDRYDKLQVPPMIKLPLPWLGEQLSRRGRKSSR